MSLDRTEGFHEGRDKILAYKRAKERKADWMIMLDVDEYFEDRLNRKILEKMIKSKRITKYGFRIFNFHGDEKHFEARFDKLLYQSRPVRYMWKDQASGYILNEKIHGEMMQGIKGLRWISSIRIKHYGTLNQEYLRKKIDTYVRIDPDRKKEYETVRDQILPTWRWYKFEERPIFVSLQNCLWMLLTIVNYFLVRWKRIKHKR